MKKIIPLVCLYWFIITSAVWAIKPYFPQTSNPILEPWRWKQVKALSGKGISCMTEGHDGSMWFGVDKGIMHYDGYVWRMDSVKAGGLEGEITTLLTGRGGEIYAGTTLGLFQYHNSRWKRIFPSQSNLAFAVNAIIELVDGSLVAGIGTRMANNLIAGLLHILPQRDVFYGSSESIEQIKQLRMSNIELKIVPEVLTLRNITGQNVFNVLDLFLTHQQTLLAIISSYSHNGKVVIFEYDLLNNNGFVQKNIYTQKDGVKIRDYVRTTQTSDGRIWIISNAYEKGINCFDGQRWVSTRLSARFGGNDSQFSLLAVSDGTLWVDGHGKIFIYQDDNWQLYQPPDIPISSSSRLVFYETKGGTLWIGGLKNEVFMLDYSGNRWEMYLNLNFQCSTPSGEQCFLSVDGRAVLKKDTTWISYGTADGLMDMPVRIICTSQGALWAAGSHQGVAATAFFENRKWHLTQHPKLSWGIDFRAVYEARDGSLWFGCAVDIQPEKGQIGGGLCLKNPSKNKFSYMQYPNDSTFRKGTAYGIGESKDGNIWIGGRPVFCFNGKNWIEPDFPLSREEYIDCMYTSNDSILWMGSRNYGVLRYNGLEWTKFTIENGLVSNTIITILAASNKNVWVATDRDICHYDGRSWTSDIFPAQMTMVREGGSFAMSRDGQLWINRSSRDWKRRGLTGLVTLAEAYPNFWTVKYQPDKRAPNTAFKKESLKLKEVGPQGNTTIFWEGNDFWEITPQDKIQFAFRLNNDSWSAFQAIDHHTFLSLAPGNYRLEVRARDLDFNVDETPAVMNFKVMLPLWQQPLFIILVVIALMIISFLEIRILRRDRRLRVLNEALSKQNMTLESYSHQLEKQRDEIKQQRDQLGDMVKKVNELSQARLRFFSTISHEFRTPLTLILGPIEKLLNSRVDVNREEQQSLYQIIGRNAHRLLRLINQILDIYKVEEGALHFQPQPGDIIRFIREIFSLFKSLAEQWQIDYTLLLSDASFITSFDADKIEKILFNLISNAFKNTPEHAKIAVEFSKTTLKGDSDLPGKSVQDALQIIVRDDGRGIPPKDIDHIFDRFYQVDHPLDAHRHISSGIGLSYIKELVSVMHGQISVQSEPGIETVFTVVIPLVVASEVDQKNVDNLAEMKSSLSKEIHSALDELKRTLEDKNMSDSQQDALLSDTTEDKPLILVVDDDPDVRHYLSRFLKQEYRIEIAKNGAEGLEKAITLQPHLIISDIMMPEMDGIEYCKRLKSDFNTSHIPIILLTGRTLFKHKMEGLSTGADDYIKKPFRQQLLKVRIKNLISSRQKLKERFQNELQIQPKEIATTSIDAEFLEKAINCIHEHLDEPQFDAAKMGYAIGVSRVQLYRKIRALTGKTVNQFIKSIRLKQAAIMIVNKKSISETAFAVGFTEHSNFTTNFKKEFGISPSEYALRESSSSK
ncbi:response regulator [candidate division KSB1 bacterium]|nr:response regulator [candidate division KSB1 bacterium]